jgi:hypothetical protein
MSVTINCSASINPLCTPLGVVRSRFGPSRTLTLPSVALMSPFSCIKRQTVTTSCRA